MKPDICTSPICDQNDYDKCHESGYRDCPKCKYAFYKGEGTDKDGKIWRWEYRPQFGPEFVTKAGWLVKYQPIEGDPAWDLFYRWKKEKRL